MALFVGGTSTDNSLDDYEEGTWTPKIMYYSSGSWYDTTMTTVGNKSAKYTKIGDMVYVDMGWDSFEVQNSNYCVIGGLPFAGGHRGSISVAYTNAVNNHQNQGCLVSTGSTLIEFYYSSNNWNSWKNNSSGLYMYLAGTYKAS